MDGINPTLGFVVLIFGLSGNARDDAANDPATNIDMKQVTGCPALMIAGDPLEPASLESWADAFWNSAASASVLPEVIDPNWADAAFAEIEVSKPTGDLALPVLDQGSDPVMRRTVPAGTNEIAADADRDPCGAKR